MAQHNFGLVGMFEPESLGVPGKRVFRLLIDGKHPASATLWIEKEQLYGISIALKNLLESEPWKEGQGANVPKIDDAGYLEGDSSEILEFKVGRLGLAFGPGKEYVTLFFHDFRDEAEEPEDPYSDDNDDDEGMEDFTGREEALPKAKLQISIEVARSEEFVNRSLELCASGRGTDSLSRQALVATGKVNPNTNGHFKH
jgi:hypothetical protein